MSMPSPKRRKTAHRWCDADDLDDYYWSSDDYNRREADLESMLRRFQWYLIGNNKKQSRIPKEFILKVANFVFVDGLEGKHVTFGSTGEISSPLFDILTSGKNDIKTESDEMTPLFHAYAIQCGGAETLALCKSDMLADLNLPSTQSFPTEMKLAKSLMDIGEGVCMRIASSLPGDEAAQGERNRLLCHRNGALAELPKIMNKTLTDEQDFIFVNGRFRFVINDLLDATRPLPGVRPQGSQLTNIWYAMDETELEAELSALLPFAKRLDQQQGVVDQVESMHLVIKEAINDIAITMELNESYLVVDWIQHLAAKCPCKSKPALEGSWLDFGAKFVIGFVASHYIGLRHWTRGTCNYPHPDMWARIESMERRLQLLKSYQLNPLSEPSPETKMWELRQSKDRLISSHAMLLKRAKTLEADRNYWMRAALEAKEEETAPSK